MQPINDFTPCPNNPLGRELEKIMMIRELVVIGRRLVPTEVDPEAVEDIRIRYLSLFREILYEGIGLSIFRNAENAHNALLYIYDLLQSVSTTQTVRGYSSGFTYMLNFNNLISHKKGESINDFVITKNGSMFFILLKEYLDENPTEASKAILTGEGLSESVGDESEMSL